MTEKTSKAPNRWPLLDFLRATAALLVLFKHTHLAYFHYTDALAQPGLFLKLFYFVTDFGPRGRRHIFCAERFPDRGKSRRFHAAG